MAATEAAVGLAFAVGMHIDPVAHTLIPVVIGVGAAAMKRLSNRSSEYKRKTWIEPFRS